ncbi:DUF1810 domain-containing protein [Siphonobacter curvatus]|uniref:DUF1810 domain-containing protein n=1 Tax=Siphonobacter curvatus TaxID=2094562 RepID=A0A2S7IK40_9BACT|nr:DUF1810 domain-containing protein [Siphonobacter curvatus]PQA56962.1 DUF1810 domain-containing protein [Siphonobacter curvatus]
MDLNRFIEAQQEEYAQALSEIKNGRKRSHWMWYIFPQLKGLGYSHMAQHYGIADRAEAQAYVQHPVLGPRLIEISQALLDLPIANATVVLGSPDDLKLRSSMTLFATLEASDPVFQRVLDKFYQGEADAQTLHLLG